MWEVAYTAPQPDEIEVSLFGPGFGECIVIHYGDGRWLVVDSCVDDGKPVALTYFQKIGVDPAAAVSHFVISHFDNDHIGGATELYSACSAAQIVSGDVFPN